MYTVVKELDFQIQFLFHAANKLFDYHLSIQQMTSEDRQGDTAIFSQQNHKILAKASPK